MAELKPFEFIMKIDFGANDGVTAVAHAKKVAELVRCKDCTHRDPEDHKCDSGQLERAGCVFPVNDDYFCAYGVKK